MGGHPQEDHGLHERSRARQRSLPRDLSWTCWRHYYLVHVPGISGDASSASPHVLVPQTCAAIASSSLPREKSASCVLSRRFAHITRRHVPVLVCLAAFEWAGTRLSLPHACTCILLIRILVAYRPCQRKETSDGAPNFLKRMCFRRSFQPVSSTFLVDSVRYTT